MADFQSDSMAPLASMEDLSVIGTPFGTPLPSPRTRARWSQHRLSSASLASEGKPVNPQQEPQPQPVVLRDSHGDPNPLPRGEPLARPDYLDTQPLLAFGTPQSVGLHSPERPNTNQTPFFTSTPVKPGRNSPFGDEQDVVSRRFASPARTQADLLRKNAIMNQQNQLPYTLPSPSQYHYARISRPPSHGFAKSCDPIQEEDPNQDNPNVATANIHPVRRYQRRTPPRRAWGPADPQGEEEYHRILNQAPVNTSNDLGNNSQNERLLESRPQKIEFMNTSRRPQNGQSSTMGSNYGYRVGATEEFVFGGEGIPRDRYMALTDLLFPATNI